MSCKCRAGHAAAALSGEGRGNVFLLLIEMNRACCKLENMYARFGKISDYTPRTNFCTFAASWYATTRRGCYLYPVLPRVPRPGRQLHGLQDVRRRHLRRSERQRGVRGFGAWFRRCRLCRRRGDEGGEERGGVPGRDAGQVFPHRVGHGVCLRTLPQRHHILSGFIQLHSVPFRSILKRGGAVCTS